ncbi:hypothetical protein FIBSPDRAFT_932810 [Athelia psychrophila]|uniref:Uncharacterized protein n=1 Tax=Athelia psychrophila TaxID=1759441 RepID=A0A166I3M9_9AGAM|nr:hypothetical protein FIBSPDRAFT_932810 [Fibularhizoctonia sp. CBS 109695]
MASIMVSSLDMSLDHSIFYPYAYPPESLAHLQYFLDDGIAGCPSITFEGDELVLGFPEYMGLPPKYYYTRPTYWGPLEQRPAVANVAPSASSFPTIADLRAASSGSTPLGATASSSFAYAEETRLCPFCYRVFRRSSMDASLERHRKDHHPSQEGLTAHKGFQGFLRDGSRYANTHIDFLDVGNEAWSLSVVVNSTKISDSVRRHIYGIIGTVRNISTSYNIVSQCLQSVMASLQL